MLIEARLLMALTAAAAAGVYGLRGFPLRSDDVFLSVIDARRPDVLHSVAYSDALLWLSTPFFLASLIASLVTITVYRNAAGLLPSTPTLAGARGAPDAVTRAG